MIRGLTYRTNQLRIRCGYAWRSGSHWLASSLVRRHVPEQPQVSAVITGRNDDYQADFRQRLHSTTKWNLQHSVDEVIFVEWNPPANKDLLSIELAHQFPEVRCFVVPTEVHNNICENTNLALMEYHAKNVGIRRAAGTWVIAMNADVALAPDAVRQINRIRQSNVIRSSAWTATRYDIPWDEHREKPFGFSDCLRYRRALPYHRHGTGDFLMATKAAWAKSGGYDESMTRHRIGCDIRGAAQLESFGVDLKRIGNVMHLAHAGSASEGTGVHQGVRATTDGLPYTNPANWGLSDCRETSIAERVWRLER